MRPSLRATASRQGGLVTRSQATLAGYTERELRTLTGVHGSWTVVRRGVYVDRVQWEAATGPDERQRLRDLAAHLAMELDHVMSHDTAARALRLPMLLPRHELVHTTRHGLVGTRTEGGVKHHLTRFDLPDVQHVDGMPVTSLARTAVDLAREHGIATGVMACDAVLGRGVRRAELHRELGVMRYWPHVTRARAVVDLARIGAASGGESLMRLMVAELGIGEPDPQWPIRIGGGLAWVDLRVGCHVFEFDGRIKYRDREHGGVATRSAEEVVWEERVRERLICAHGLGMSRVTWQEMFGAERERTKARLRAEYDVTCARFGLVLPERLERDAARIRASRGSWRIASGQ